MELKKLYYICICSHTILIVMFASRIMKLKPNSTTKEQMTNTPHCCSKSSPILCFLPHLLKYDPSQESLHILEMNNQLYWSYPCPLTSPETQSGGVKEHDLEHFRILKLPLTSSSYGLGNSAHAQSLCTEACPACKCYLFKLR